MSRHWIVQRYHEPQGWYPVYRGPERMALCTYWALGERTEHGYLRLINPRGAIIEAIRRPPAAERPTKSGNRSKPRKE